MAGRAVDAWNMDVTLDTSSRRYKPQITEDERDLRFKKWKMAIERSLGWDQGT